MKEIIHRTLEEWRAEGTALFGEDKTKWRFVCASCGNIQSIADFEKAGIEEADSKAHFSCIGRWTGGKGTLGSKEVPCNYTSGGLFKLSPMYVKTPDGEETSIFDFDRSQPCAPAI